MLTAVAVPFDLIPTELIRPHKLARQPHVCDDWPEFQFHFGSPSALLPISHAGGRVSLARWGCRREECRVLPSTGWTTDERVKSGYWREVGAEEVTIPAARGYDGGYWYAIPSPIRAVLVRPVDGQVHVFVVCQPASNYYAVMTKSEWMPAMIEGSL